MDIKFDFFIDWREFLIKSIKAEGYPVDENQNVDELGIIYYQIKLRKISTKPRKLYKSDVFYCPPKYLTGLSNLENTIINGFDLKPFCSTWLDDLDYQDKMLFDWNIHHFHLGNAMESNGYVTRTGPLAYAFVTEEAIHLIQIFSHGEWTNKDLLNIVDNNWPLLLEPYYIRGVVDIEYELDSIDHQKLRRKNINTINKINGKFLMGPGMGLTSDGSSTRAVISKNIACERLQDIEKHFKVIIEELKASIKYDESKGNRFHLYFLREGVYVGCEDHKIGILISEIFY